jgi:hypothetical protein
MQESLQRARFRPGTPLGCDPMHGSRQSLVARLADAVDLAIDFATLGEYGLEPVSTERRCGKRQRLPGDPSSVSLAASGRSRLRPARL